MKLQLNGSLVELEEAITISDLLARHKLKPEAVVVEYNLQVPPKSEYDRISVQDGDRIEIVKFMGGG